MDRLEAYVKLRLMSNLKVCPCSVALFDLFIYDTVRGLSSQAELSQVQFRLND